MLNNPLPALCHGLFHHESPLRFAVESAPTFRCNEERGRLGCKRLDRRVSSSVVLLTLPLVAAYSILCSSLQLRGSAASSVYTATITLICSSQAPRTLTTVRASICTCRGCNSAVALSPYWCTGLAQYCLRRLSNVKRQNV